MKAILATVLRNALGVDCTNNGLSSRQPSVTIPCDDGYIDANVFDESMVRVVRNEFGVHLEPWTHRNNKVLMFGGNFAYSLDERFTRINNGHPIPIWDREECEMKLKEFIENYDLEVDVSTDYADNFTDENGKEWGACISFCPGSKLSEQGKKRWAEIMDLNVEVDGCNAVVYIPNADEKVMEKIHTDVMFLFYTLAGHVSSSFYEQMIEEN